MSIKKTGAKLFLYVVAVFVVVYSLFPFYWAINSSLKLPQELFNTNYWPHHPEWKNYLNIFTRQPFGRTIFNSFVVAFMTVSVSLVLGMLAAYGFGRHNFHGRRLLLFSFLAVSMFPQIAVLSGLFELIRFFGLYNNLFGLAFTYLIFTMPFSVWLLTSFVRGVPRALEEVAILEGATPLTLVFKIFVPLMMPAFVTTGLLAFIAAWNEFLFALSLTMSSKARTVPVAIALMSGASEHELPWANIMAASVVVTLPLVILVLIFQKRIVSGLTTGAVKG